MSNPEKDSIGDDIESSGGKNANRPAVTVVRSRGKRKMK
jgi:hypothetical protein